MAIPARMRELTLAASLALLTVVTPAAAANMTPIATSADHVAIQGYDTVAYFTDGKAVKGNAEYSYNWSDATWWFSTPAHRAMFAADPDRYMPQFGGFCSVAMRGGGLDPANPETWAIVGGKLYMVNGTQTDLSEWKSNVSSNIRMAEEEWQRALGK